MKFPMRAGLALHYNLCDPFSIRRPTSNEGYELLTARRSCFTLLNACAQSA